MVEILGSLKVTETHHLSADRQVRPKMINQP
jgi:hypothetical protein